MAVFIGSIDIFCGLEEETQFWEALIRIYLYPLDANKKEQAQVQDELKELRNTVVFGFFLIDILLIVTILALSLTIEQVRHRHFQHNYRTVTSLSFSA